MDTIKASKPVVARLSESQRKLIVVSVTNINHLIKSPLRDSVSDWNLGRSVKI